MSGENKRQKKVQALIVYYCRALAEDRQDGTKFDSDVINALEAVKRQYADSPAKDYKMDGELKELGFYPPGTVGIAGCTTIPCFHGKMPDQNLPASLCVIGHCECTESPRQSMRRSKVFTDMEAELKEAARLAKNRRARELYASRKRARI